MPRDIRRAQMKILLMQKVKRLELMAWARTQRAEIPLRLQNIVMQKAMDLNTSWRT